MKMKTLHLTKNEMEDFAVLANEIACSMADEEEKNKSILTNEQYEQASARREKLRSAVGRNRLTRQLQIAVYRFKRV